MGLRNQFITCMASHIYFPLIKAIYKPAYSPISSEVLEHCPADSLGAHTYLFLKQRQIEFFHGYEVHDLKHVVLNFDTDTRGEIMMQYFELGNGNSSLVVWIVLVFGTLLMPEYLRLYRQAYHQGQQCQKIDSLQLENELQSSLLAIRKKLNLKINLS